MPSYKTMWLEEKALREELQDILKEDGLEARWRLMKTKIMQQKRVVDNAVPEGGEVGPMASVRRPRGQII